MASTRADVRDAIRELLGDMNPSEPAFNDFRINDSIQRNVHLLAARCAMPRETVGSVSLVNGTYEYTVSSTAKTVTLVLLNSTGDELTFVPWEQFNAYYKQDTATPRASGVPREYTLRENVSNTLTIRFGPTPNASGTAKLHLSILPALLTSDIISIPFPNDLVRGLELMCAIELVLAMDDVRRKQIGVSASVVPMWTASVDRVVRDYHRRMGDLGARQNRIVRGNRRVGGHAFWGAW